MGLTERNVEVYECPSCGSLERHEEGTCCGESLRPVDTTIPYEPPEVESVVKEVFDLSSTDLSICSALMSEGEATVKELADQLSLDRSTVSRHLDHMVQVGIVTKEPRILEEGGQINLYAPAPIEEIHRTLQLGLYAWLDDAEDVLYELHQERLERMVKEAEVEETDRTDVDDESHSFISRLIYQG
ncbi:helix-turn-helix domain-containing protein [Halorussus sp. AFM4]|uniref:helix-turn-helix domain-containing protein n=1 Tax=Halorussus sp. AFM4 TaxID=3421651 RepID=UPI003EBC80A9